MMELLIGPDGTARERMCGANAGRDTVAGDVMTITSNGNGVTYMDMTILS